MNALNMRISVLVVLSLVSLFFLSVHAQENHDAEPAIKIKSGEKMIVIAGRSFINKEPFYTGPELTINDPSSKTYGYQLILPVGSRIKRMIVEAADTSEMGYLYVILRRDRAEGVPKGKFLDQTNSTTIKSDSIRNFYQLDSNPLNIKVKRGWTYWIQVGVQGLFVEDEAVSLGTVKIIYEP